MLAAFVQALPVGRAQPLEFERQLSVAELVAEGQDAATVEKVARLVWAAEYKRRQSAPGVKITPMAFGRDRRWPITNRWRFG